MEREIKNKVIVITGGAEGLGYAIADSFLKVDAKTVLILDINEAKGAKAAKELNNKHGNYKAKFIKCDVTKDLETVSENIFDIYMKIDVLVNNAGTVDEKNPRKVLELNTIALVEWSLKFWNHMRKDKGGNGGTIINMGSLYSFLIDPFLVLYKASKFAVMGFSRSIGHEYNYKLYGVRVVVICPGFARTRLTDNLKPWEEHDKDFQDFFKSTPAQSAEDVGKGVVHVFKTADSGSGWSVVGGVVEVIS